MFDYESPKVAELATEAIEHLRLAADKVDTLLTWVENLPPGRRDRYTRASNAIELARCRMEGKFRGVKPHVECL